MKKIGLNLKKIIKLNNTYKIVKEDLNEMLDNISNFESKMEKFLSKHPEMEYSLNIVDQENDKWVIEINIRNKDEQSDTQVSEKVIKSRDTL